MTSCLLKLLYLQMGIFGKILYLVASLAAFAGIGIAGGYLVSPGRTTGEPPFVALSTQSNPISLSVRAIDGAQKEIRLSSRSINSASIVDALTRAAARDVSVQVVVSRPSGAASQASYVALRNNVGATIFIQDQPNFSTFLVVDGRISVVYQAPLDEALIARAAVGFEVRSRPEDAKCYVDLFNQIASQSTRAFN